MKKIIKLILPDKLELILAVILSLIILLVGHFSTLVDTFNIDDITEQTNQATGGFIKESAKSLSDFNISAEIATFFVWAIIGLVVLRIGIYIIKTLQYVKDLKDSSKNIFPENETYKSFLKETLIDLGLEILIITFTALAFFSAITVSLPTSLNLSRPLFVGEFAPIELAYLFGGFLIILTTIIIIFLLLGTYIHRKVLFEFLDEEYHI